MKEVIISTEAVNSYGTRVLTAGIDLEQFKRNPVLLWMHRRAWNGQDMPIGIVENLRVESGKLIGTPVFDQADERARQIESKWEQGHLRMASAALEPLETSADPALVLPGQWRETVIRSKLIEVSIVDIGANDEALQLCGAEGKVLRLAAGEDAPHLPLLKQTNNPNINPNNNLTSQMNNEQLTLLGLAAGATDEQATAALRLLKAKADSVESLQLAAMTQCVDQAIADRKILADQRDLFIKLGKAAGLEILAETLKTMPVQRKPTDVLNLSRQSAPGAGQATASYEKLGQVPADERLALRKNDPAEYMRLYKAEYGIDCPSLND